MSKKDIIEREPIGKIGFPFKGEKIRVNGRGQLVNTEEYLWWQNAENAMIEAVYTGNWHRFNEMLRHKKAKDIK